MRLDKKLILTTLCFCVLLASTGAQGIAEHSQHAMLRHELHRLAGEKVIQSIKSTEQGSAFLDALSNSEVWLSELLDSGPVKQPRRILPFLQRVWLDDNTVCQMPVNRSMATACGLALGMNSRLAEEWMWQRYLYFRDNWDKKLLNTCYGNLSTWERRYLARGPEYSSYSTAEALVYLRDRVCLPRERYVSAHSQVNYRSYNCLGGDVQRPEYYIPFKGIFTCDPEMAVEVGGVCGALSNLGAAAAIAAGIPATSMVEPGHCAFAVQTEPGKWQAANSVSWRRGMHSWMFRATWPSLMLEQACFAQPELVRRAGHLQRLARWHEEQGEIIAADKALTEATKTQPLNYGLWQERAAFVLRQGNTLDWWRNYHNDILAWLAPAHEEPAWALLTNYVYKNSEPELNDARRVALFLAYMKTFSDFGQGRWEIEKAWSWMLDQVKEVELRNSLELQLAELTIPRPGLGAVFVVWKKERCASDLAAWKSFQDWLVAHLSKGGEGGNIEAAIRSLGRTGLPAAAQSGDLESYQAIGQLCTRLYKATPTAGIVPFEGELLTAGGAINLSGIGERYDTPEKHWGVLNTYGGALHTNSEATPWIEVRLGNFGRLNGLVIQNRAGSYQGRADGARVLVSLDGKKWEQVAVLQGGKMFYRIDLGDSKPQAGWIRIERDGQCLHFARILAYGERTN
ncbi:MAG: discoidin domain-containing protein [Kiritimatiellae bacterium]|nr:discoidin domain-containing protein [Kiritimatiellia bacterium]